MSVRRPGTPALALVASLLASLLAALVVVPPPAAFAGADPRPGRVYGEVVDGETGRAVAGATVRLPDDGVEAVSDVRGRFALPRAVPAAAPYRLLRVEVTAPGFGRWTLRDAPLYPGDGLHVHAELDPQAVDHRVPGPGPSRGVPAPSLPDTAAATCSGWDYQQVPTPTIRVYRHATGAVETYDFQFYVAHVLPNEWISSWDADALGAGAIAAKTYAAYRAMTGHAAITGPPCADIRDDTFDQVFDPSWSTASTDLAVAATFGSIAYRDGGLFLAQYWSGSPGDPCAPVTSGTYAGRMSQWGTQTCGQEGVLWPAIVSTFYQGATWTYLKNLLLNPGAESGSGEYPWTGSKATVTRTGPGGAYLGNWYLHVVPTSSRRDGVVRQQRPYPGTSATTYHAQAALRCPADAGRACQMLMKLVLVPASGKVKRFTSRLTVADDGAWHVVAMDTPPAGIAHAQAWFTVSGAVAFDLDAAVLNSPYGGP